MNEKDINTYKVKIALLTDKNIELQQRIDKAREYIEENCGADNRLNLKIILLGDKENE